MTTIDPGVVYRRTATGDQAVAERTRLVQRNLRLALALVNGRRSAGDIIAKLPDPLIAASALAELAHAGYIQPRGEAGDKVASEAQPQPESAAADAGQPAPAAESEIVVDPPGAPESASESAPHEDTAESSVREAAPEPAPAPAQREEPQAAPDAGLNASPPAPTPKTIARRPEDVRQQYKAEPSQPEALPPPSEPEQPAGPVPVQPAAPETEQAQAAQPAPTDDAPSDRREPTMVEAEPAPTPEPEPEPAAVAVAAKPAPAARGKPAFSLPRFRFRPWRWAGGAALLAAVGLAVGILAYPYDQRFRPQLESALTQAMGTPVRVDELVLRPWPRPGLVARRIDAGPAGRASELRIVPVPGDLLGGRLRVARAEFSGMRVPLTALGTWAGIAWGSERPGLVRTLALADVAVILGGDVVAGWAGTMEPSGEGWRAQLRHDAADWSADIAGAPGRTRIALRSGAWSAPGAGALKFDGLDMEGTLEAGRIVLSRIDGKLLDGVMEGRGELAWQDGPRFAVDMKFKTLSLARASREIRPDLPLSGLTEAQLRVTAKAPTLEALAGAATVDGRFSMERGSVRLDLLEALRRRDGTIVAGGRTDFHSIAGRIGTRAGRWQVRELQISDGRLHAGGYVDIDAEGKLAGQLAISIQAPGAVERTSAAVGGTLAAPTLLPDGGRR